MINFKKKLEATNVKLKTNPIELYDTLDRKSVTGPLRPAQQEILEKWYNNYRRKRDTIIKLHTGEGKTLVGLLILLSSLNSNEGPCLYVCPNIYLVKQVCEEAEKFGIPYCKVTEEGIPAEFENNKSILILHAQKIFNGLSIFGVERRCVEVGAIVLDDSHACIDVIKNAFTVNIFREDNENLYLRILDLFEDDLKQQREGSLLDIKDGDSETIMPIPYWSWIEKRSEVLCILSENKEQNCIKFSWALMRDNLKNYCCYISGKSIQIALQDNESIEAFGSFDKAKRRILMSATTQDDSFFIKGLGFSAESVMNPIINKRIKWSGEKMIIIPSELFDGCDREMITNFFANVDNYSYGMVSLVPNRKKVSYYANKKAIILDKDTIFTELDKLRKHEFQNLLVMINRYDGIDLPDEACRILITDSLPGFSDLADRYEEMCRPDSVIINKKIAQRIEQGLGRGVRGEKDYCVVIMIGSDLIKFVRSEKTRKYFSTQTKQQINIGFEIANSEDESNKSDSEYIKEILSIAGQCISRDDNWKEYYKMEMDKIEEEQVSRDIYEQLECERYIDETYSEGNIEEACTKLQNYINEHSFSNEDKGWYLQKLARLYYSLSIEKSNEIQRTAFKKNSQLLKPKNGIEYRKITYIEQNRMSNIKSFINGYENYKEFFWGINEILDNLSFGVQSDKFEESLKQIGLLLGYQSQRPDKDTRTGPDNLWCGDKNEYIMFECKNKVAEGRGFISKKEVGQMNNHCGWFEKHYGSATRVRRYIISPTKEVDGSANFTHDVKIIRKNNLNMLKDNIKLFVKELERYEISNITEEKLQEMINMFSLNLNDFDKKYSVKPFQK